MEKIKLEPKKLDDERTILEICNILDEMVHILFKRNIVNKKR